MDSTGILLHAGQDRRRTAPHWRIFGAGGVLVAVCLLGSGVAEAAVVPRRFPLSTGGGPVAAGTVASAPANDAFTITTRSGSTLTVDVSNSTTYVERGVSSPSLSDVTKGALVAVFGTTSGTTVAASEVNIWVPTTSHPAPVAAGTVASAPANDAFTITTRSGSTLTVDVSNSTTYAERGVSSPSLSDVTKGALVAVFGTTSGTTVTASEVVIAHPRHPGSFATAGTVASAPSNNTFTVTTWNGTTLTVDVSSSTSYVERGVSSPSLSDVTEGSLVGVFGTTSGTTVSASEVVIAPPKPSGSFATAGTVASVPSNNTFTVRTWNGTTMTVEVSDSTTYGDYGVSSPSLSDVTSGELVGVFGTTSGTTVTASEVVIAGSRHGGMFGFGRPFRFGRGFGGFGGFGFGRGF